MDTSSASKIDPKLLNCVCVLHGDKYDWIYVENLYRMISKFISQPIKFHIFTEPQRSVPSHMIKHDLVEWLGIAGPKKSWWYKMQVFDPTRVTGPVLYIDLDVIIINDLNWIRDLDLDYFWAIRDWRYLWRPQWNGVNSSVMYWNTERFRNIWDEFQNRGIDSVSAHYRGDQDFITDSLSEGQRQFFPLEFIKSWRWEIKDGGFNFKTRMYKRPGIGSMLDSRTKIMVFHGNPKPHEIADPIIQTLWNSNFE